jgi:hypothetical protein
MKESQKAKAILVYLESAVGTAEEVADINNMNLLFSASS